MTGAAAATRRDDRGCLGVRRSGASLVGVAIGPPCVGGGATPAEIVTVLHLCVSQGAQSINVAVPILDEEFELFTENQSTTTDLEI